MLSVSEVYSQNIIADSRDMPFRVTLDGLPLNDENGISVTHMVINESVSGDSGVAIGTSNSSTLKLTLKILDHSAVTPIDFSDMLVEPESGLVLPDGTVEYVPLGKFWVTDYSTSNDFKTFTLNCADGMYHLTGEYVSELTYPTHIRNVVNEIVSQTGIAFVSDLPDLTIRVKPEGMTHREVIGHLAGCCGRNARFNRLGQLEFIWYTDTGKTIERTNQYLNGFQRLNASPLSVGFEVTGKQEMYTVKVVSDGNGGVIATPGEKVLEGETVVLSISPFSGYEVAEITAVTDSGADVTLYMDSEGGRTFVQPDSNVTVTVSFREVDATKFGVTVRSNGNGSIGYGLSEAGEDVFPEGETVLLFVYPDDGYEVDSFVTTPTSITLTEAGTTSTGGLVYEFTMPKSDVTVTADFRVIPTAYRINRLVDESQYEAPGYIFIEEGGTGDFVWNATEGTTIYVTFSANDGYEFDYYESSVTLTQVGVHTYNFTMPAEEVSITAHYKLYEDTAKAGLLSWLQPLANALPPTEKPYWAIFYKEDRNVMSHRKFHLIWFDSWTATSYETEYGKTIYSIQFDGYYHCGSTDGDKPNTRWQKWDTSAWSGNGVSGTKLEWDAIVDGHPWSGNVTYSSDYSLLASNNNLFYKSGSWIFKKCENAVSTTQTEYLVSNEIGDIREWNSLTYYKCPDTFSTPAPAKYWMVVEAGGSLCMTPDEDGSGYTSSDNCDGLYVLYFDSISFKSVGAVYSNSDEEFYVATVRNGHYVALARSSSDWGTLYDVADGDVIGLRHPSNGSKESHDTLGRFYFAGILSSNSRWIIVNTSVSAKHARICQCNSATNSSSTVSTFSLRSSTVPVGITYTNPLIYEKMVEPISELVQGITYTPAKLKHRGNPALQAGDIVTALDENGTAHTILIMQQTMTFGGGMNSEISCPGQTEKKTQFTAIGPVSTQIKKEVQQSNMDLERRIATNNSLVYASIYKTISSTEAKLRSVVEWQTEKSATIAELEQTADEHGAKISLVVGQNGIVNEDGAVQGNIVIEAINGESTTTINADKININGAISANGTFKIDTDGYMEATGGNISGWELGNEFIGQNGTYLVAEGYLHDPEDTFMENERCIRMCAGLDENKSVENFYLAYITLDKNASYTGTVRIPYLMKDGAFSLENMALCYLYPDTTRGYAISSTDVEYTMTKTDLTDIEITLTVKSSYAHYEECKNGVIQMAFTFYNAVPRWYVLNDGFMYATSCYCQGTFLGSDGKSLEARIAALEEKIGG